MSEFYIKPDKVLSLFIAWNNNREREERLTSHCVLGHSFFPFAVIISSDEQASDLILYISTITDGNTDPAAQGFQGTHTERQCDSVQVSNGHAQIAIKQRQARKRN